MSGNVITFGCGSFSQVVYVDIGNNICWPGDDVVAKLPSLMLSGWGYASYLLDLSRKEKLGELAWLRKLCRTRWVQILSRLQAIDGVI